MMMMELMMARSDGIIEDYGKCTTTTSIKL